MTAPARPKATQQEPPDHPTDSRPGTWSRLELMQMNARFAAAMARALAEETQTEPPAQGTQHPRLGSLGNEGLGRLSQGLAPA
jgi:hypothetical protein